MSVARGELLSALSLIKRTGLAFSFAIVKDQPASGTCSAGGATG
ncbi:MAG TPA: hypothetical protein VF280_18295 [Burkholderiales bacterium]|jgi:hypothetical protein